MYTENTELNSKGFVTESDNGNISAVKKTLNKSEGIINTEAKEALTEISLVAVAPYNDVIYSLDSDVAEITGTTVRFNKAGRAGLRAVSKKTGEYSEVQLYLEGYEAEMHFEENKEAVEGKTVNLKDYIEKGDVELAKAVLEKGLEEKYSDITYISSNPQIAEVDKNTGKVTIKQSGTVEITAEAEPWQEYGYLKKASCKYKITIKSIELDIKLKDSRNENGNIMYDDKDTINLSDASDLFEYDKNGNGTKLTLPIKVYVNNEEATRVKLI